LCIKSALIAETIACREKIDSCKFEIYALETAKIYVNLYPWYYMPSSVHKILMHGEKVIKSALLPIDQLTEEAQETRNKLQALSRISGSVIDMLLMLT